MPAGRRRQRQQQQQQQQQRQQRQQRQEQQRQQRQEQQRQQPQQGGRRDQANGFPPSTGEHTQLQRNEEVRCSNHDKTHTLVLSSDGMLSEQWATASAHCSKTRLVKELEDHHIVQVACGDQHAMALSRGGELFTWGQNAHGQLGVSRQTALIPKPQLVERLKGIPLAQIAAGGAHNVAVSLSGAVYSWGKNDFGQLGLGDTRDRGCPSYVKALEHWKTVFVSCGADHTAVLSKEGLVCTFGAGGSGQLGHNSTQNELVPRLVAELWGARVSQIACGRQHTLVYVPSLDKVFSFGSDEEGHLEDKRKPNQLIPLPIDSPVNTGKSHQENNTSQKVIEITAGGNRSIVLCKKNKNSCLNGIATLKDEDVDAWISSSSTQDWESLKKNIGLIFSSEACINGSFLAKRDKHFKTSKEVSGVDMAEVQHFYEKVSKVPKVFGEVLKGILKLQPSLSSSPISPENFRVYLILPFLLQGEFNTSYALRRVAQTITKLQPHNLRTLECLWSNLETSFFKQLVILYQRVSQMILSDFLKDVRRWLGSLYHLDPRQTVTLQMLQILYQVNSRTGTRVKENNFYVPEVKEIICMCHFVDIRGTALWMLSRYPCIFDIQGKIMVHFTERNTRASHSSDIPLIVATMKLWRFPVKRQCLLQDIWTHLNKASTQQFKNLLQVSFEGEPGADEGGLGRELFSVAARTLCQPDTGPFHHLASGLLWFPSQQAPSSQHTFFQIGTLCGMALYNGYTVPFPFPRTLYKKLLGLEPDLGDLEELLPAAGRSLQRILDEECDQVLESLDMDFTIMEEGGSMVPVELKENGANIPVTKYNRKEFVDLYVNYVLNKSIQKPFEDFMQGFLRGCPAKQWKIFLPAELQIVIQGHTEFDWNLLEKNVKYIHYKELDQTIRNFWAVFHKLPEEKKKMFLAFLSGSDRIPACEMEHFSFYIVDPQAENPDECYFFANTCRRILFLPRYSNKRILKKKLLCTIEHNENFGLR
ncbi:E3 ISG15--protein ligase HERC5-like isoform X1 [Patagioenas fasciata]|uniref:E3 ISG15--protein ligase HERC5-like isoform X1 n=1 Tax=Patagioenas fasciata TaxID=372321 RepID=UPI0032E914FD